MDNDIKTLLCISIVCKILVAIIVFLAVFNAVTKMKQFGLKNIVNQIWNGKQTTTDTGK